MKRESLAKCDEAATQLLSDVFPVISWQIFQFCSWRLQNPRNWVAIRDVSKKPVTGWPIFSFLAQLDSLSFPSWHKDALVITLSKNANIHAKEYQLYLPSKEELQKNLVECGEAG